MTRDVASAPGKLYDRIRQAGWDPSITGSWMGEVEEGCAGPAPGISLPAMTSSSSIGRLLLRARLSPLVGWIVFVLGLLLLSAWATLSLLFVLDQRSRGVGDATLWIGPLVMAFFFVPIGAVLAVKGYRGRVLGLDLHEGGASRSRIARVGTRSGGARSSRSASERVGHVANVGFGVGVTTHEVSQVDGCVVPTPAPIVVDNRFPDHVRLADRVLAAAAEGMLPRYEQALRSGKRMSFGPLVAARWVGAASGAGHYPWSAIGRVPMGGVEVPKRSTRSTPAMVHRWPRSGTRGVANEAILRVLLGRLGKLGDSGQERPPPGTMPSPRFSDWLPTRAG